MSGKKFGNSAALSRSRFDPDRVPLPAHSAPLADGDSSEGSGAAGMASSVTPGALAAIGEPLLLAGEAE